MNEHCRRERNLFLGEFNFTLPDILTIKTIVIGINTIIYIVKYINYDGMT